MAPSQGPNMEVTSRPGPRPSKVQPHFWVLPETEPTSVGVEDIGPAVSQTPWPPLVCHTLQLKTYLTSLHLESLLKQCVPWNRFPVVHLFYCTNFCEILRSPNQHDGWGFSCAKSCEPVLQFYNHGLNDGFGDSPEKPRGRDVNKAMSSSDSPEDGGSHSSGPPSACLCGAQ